MSTFTYKARLHQLVEDLSEDEAEDALAFLKGALTDAAGPSPAEVGLPGDLHIQAAKVQDLRYGENPHQGGALYVLDWPPTGLAGARQLQGPPMSYTNWLDCESAHGLVAQFYEPAAAIVKHTNPCGFALGANIASAYRLAYECDPRAAYGGAVALNRSIDAAVAQSLCETFLNVVVTPGADAVTALRDRAKLRVLVIDDQVCEQLEIRSIAGGLLAQTHDRLQPRRFEMQVVTRRQPTEMQWSELLIAWKLARGVKSNSIVIVRDKAAVGVGAGQMSRVEAAELAIGRAAARATGAVAASDGPIPFIDSLEALARAGVDAVIQPSGSVKDDEVAAAADELGLALVNAPSRHFRH
jgi:phosphoribosylaminoimidazolecarboxamide formyltransferase/IMP cyclohydrolase